jgi:hypothetical protein
MAGVAVIVNEANSLAGTMCPGKKADMFPGALRDFMPMVENNCTIERKMLQGDLASRRHSLQGFACDPRRAIGHEARRKRPDQIPAFAVVDDRAAHRLRESMTRGIDSYSGQFGNPRGVRFLAGWY